MAVINLFNPVLGTEEKVQAVTNPSPGSVFFTTDTRKIYLELDEARKRLPMGGNINLFYGNMQLTSPPVEEQKEFEFKITEIVGNETSEHPLIPNEDDLILNTDGCFYKVKAIIGEGPLTTLTTEKLTIAGTGGGGGGGSTGGGGSGSLAGFSMSRLKFDYQSVLFQKPCPVSFAAKLTDDLGDPVRGNIGTYTLYIKGIQKATGPVVGVTSGDVMDLNTLVASEINTIDVGPYLPLSSDPVEVKISVQSSAGGAPITRAGYVSTTDMKLTWNYDETQVNEYLTDSKETMMLEWEVSGVGLEKTTYISINGESQFAIATGTNTKFTYELNFKELNLWHGAHTIKMWAEATVGGVATPTEPVYKNIMVAKDNSTVTIISVGLFTKELMQYNTIDIPIIIYSANNTAGNAVVKLIENGEEKDTWENVKNCDPTNSWSYTPTIAGEGLTLAVQSGGQEYSTSINVKAIDIDIQEKSNYVYKFKANEFSSNTNVKNWTNGAKNEADKVTVSFSEKFDWINGGLKTESDGKGGRRQYVAVKAGSTMTINHKLWFNNAPGYGKNLKVIFKATNCRDYDAQVLSCKTDEKRIYIDTSVEHLMLDENNVTLEYAKTVSRNGDTIVLNDVSSAIIDVTSKESRDLFDKTYVKFDDTVYQCRFIELDKDAKTYYAAWYKVSVVDSFNGLVLNAQNATMRTNNEEINTQYCEDTYIEFEMEVTPKSSGRQYIKFWIDGVPSNFTNYADGDRFGVVGDINGPSITIGSPDCDVYVYLIKLYETGLSIDEHMQNFYADAPNAEEMVRRYKRNDIMDKNRDGEIDPMRLAKANPDCLVHIYDIPHIPKTKKDKTFPCTYEQYKGEGNAKIRAEGVMIKVQGTSSERYVVSAANLDTDFEYDKDGNAPTGLIDVASGKVMKDGWSMDGGTAIPVNFTCTKVNVASCENANNALNQEWYNLFQPYKSVLRCKNPRARDTMQFTNGVLFMVDRNKTFDIDASGDAAKSNNIFGETPGYIDNPYAKFYSLGQMGNSKDNIHVFHDTSNPKECCIEVADNQMPQQWMVSDNYNKTDIGAKEGYFEFRYPEDDYTQEMVDGWNRLVYWMAHSNPSPKYNKFENITSEDQYKKFSINRKTYTPIDVYVMNEDRTSYQKVDGFDPNISTYYTETEHVYGHTNLKLPDNVQKVFPPYKFKGFKAENEKNSKGELWQKDYKPIIQGFTVDTYANNQEGAEPYEYDTYEYRMAKMLSECEDYLIMDSILFHYLFIERHCMIDNVAKNTFWSTEDCQHWSLIKDYDNDTADGNDNNGKFTRNYGMEPMDKLNENAYVFNAHQSVWFNFIAGLYQACEHMYQQLDTKTAVYNGREVKLWDSKDYLQAFTDWQGLIPERCWIEDYQRKYFRPAEIYNDTMYQQMIEGGQKKYQRKQYETYEDTYMSSKYHGVTATANSVQWRPTGTDLSEVKIPVKVYSDCYITVIGGGQVDSTRVKRNETAYITSPTDDINNATMVIYPMGVLTKIGDINSGQIGTFAPEILSFAGAKKLREVVYATEDNPVQNFGLEQGVSFAGNTLLEKLYISNLIKYTQGLDLSQCPSLKELNAVNSTFTNIVIADGAPVTSIKLEKPTSLNLSNLTELQELDIKDYELLKVLSLNNIDNGAISSKDILEKTLAQVDSNETNDYVRYSLTNVKWNMTKSNEFNGNNIILLDNLLDRTKAQPVFEADEKTEKPYSAVLTGDLTIAPSAYSNTSANALITYNTYITKDKFANLDLEFESANSKLYNITIYDGDNNSFWQRKIAPGEVVNAAFLSGGPNGAFESKNIHKSPTGEHNFEFLNKWTVKDDSGNVVAEISSAEPISSTAVTKNLHYYPTFKTTIRTYEISVRAKHPVTEEIVQLKFGEYPYGTPLAEVIPQDVVPHVDTTGLNLSLYEAYDFKGYSLVEDSEIIVSDKYQVKNKATLWAVFKLENDIRSIIHPEWFEVRKYTYNFEGPQSVGVEIRPKNNLVLHGKITLPTTMMWEGKETPVIAVGGFGGSSGNKVSKQRVTHVFIEKGKQNSLYAVLDNAFSYMTTLEYFDFDNSAVRTISYSAFAETGNMTNTSFGANLVLIHQYAFNAALKSNVVVTVTLPSTLRQIGEYGFAHLRYADGSTLKIGDETALSQLDLQACQLNSFAMNSGNQYKAVEFYSHSYDTPTDKVSSNSTVADYFTPALKPEIGTLTVV